VAETEVRFARLRKAKRAGEQYEGRKRIGVHIWQLFFSSNDKLFYFLITNEILFNVKKLSKK